RSPERHRFAWACLDRSAVELADLQLGQIAFGDAAQVDLDHGSTVWRFAFGERGASAIGAELVADLVLVEGVLAYFAFGLVERHLVGAGEVMNVALAAADGAVAGHALDRKSTRLNSSHVKISYAVFCLKKKKINE